MLSYFYDKTGGLSTEIAFFLLGSDPYYMNVDSDEEFNYSQARYNF